MKKEDEVVENDTCFAAHERYKVVCEKGEYCSKRYWFDNPESLNCIILAAKQGPHKQEQIGKHFGLTRMRVCQIEKGIVQKLKRLRVIQEEL